LERSRNGAANLEPAGEAEIQFIEAGAIRIGRIFAPDEGVCIDQWPADDQVHCTFILQLSGTATCEQQRRVAYLAPGQWDVFDCEHPLHLAASHAASEQLAMLIPAKQLDPCFDLATLAARRRPGTSALSKLLCHAASVSFRELSTSDGKRAADLAHPLCLWVNLAIRERVEGEARVTSSRERLQLRAIQCVNARLRDPSLSVESVAAQLNCTTRYLQKVFQSTGQSLSEHIRVHRLNRCHSDLLDPALAHMSITEVALSWGFNSVTYFSEAFRNYFGLTPSEARRMTG